MAVNGFFNTHFITFCMAFNGLACFAKVDASHLRTSSGTASLCSSERSSSASSLNVAVKEGNKEKFEINNISGNSRKEYFLCCTTVLYTYAHTLGPNKCLTIIGQKYYALRMFLVRVSRKMFPKILLYQCFVRKSVNKFVKR